MAAKEFISGILPSQQQQCCVRVVFQAFSLVGRFLVVELLVVELVFGLSFC